MLRAHSGQDLAPNVILAWHHSFARVQSKTPSPSCYAAALLGSLRSLQGHTQQCVWDSVKLVLVGGGDSRGCPGMCRIQAAAAIRVSGKLSVVATVFVLAVQEGEMKGGAHGNLRVQSHMQLSGLAQLCGPGHGGGRNLPHQDLAMSCGEEQVGRWREPAQLHSVLVSSKVLGGP